MSEIVLWLYRLAASLRRWRVPVAPRILCILIRLTFGCHIGLGARIGRRSRLAYGGIGTIIHRNAVIGRNVYIGAGSCLGYRNGSHRGPIVEDNCLIGAGARILGDIRIGPDSVIGANAVVLHDVPPHCVAAGVPAHLIRQGIDIRDYRTRRDMEEDAPPTPS